MNTDTRYIFWPREGFYAVASFVTCIEHYPQKIPIPFNFHQKLLESLEGHPLPVYYEGSFSAPPVFDDDLMAWFLGRGEGEGVDLSDEKL